MVLAAANRSQCYRYYFWCVAMFCFWEQKNIHKGFNQYILDPSVFFLCGNYKISQCEFADWQDFQNTCSALPLTTGDMIQNSQWITETMVSTKP